MASLKKEFKDVSVSHDAPRFVLRTNLFPCIEKVSIICEQISSGSLSFVQGTKLVKYIGKKESLKKEFKDVSVSHDASRFVFHTNLVLCIGKMVLVKWRH